MSDDPEHRLSYYVNKLLSGIILEPAWFTSIEPKAVSIDKSPQAQMNWAAKKKAQGVKPYHLDWMIYQRNTGLYAQFELKAGRNDAHDGQLTTMRLLTERGIPNGCFRTVMQVYVFIRGAGFDLHGNAGNIALEIEERWRAADREASVNRPSKLALKPRAVKPTLAQIQRVEAVRRKVLF